MILDAAWQASKQASHGLMRVIMIEANSTAERDNENKIPPFCRSLSASHFGLCLSSLPYPSTLYSCCNIFCESSRHVPCPSLIKPLLLLRQHNLGLESWKDFAFHASSFQALPCPFKPYSCCANISMSVGICHPCVRQARLKASIASPTE